MNADEWSVMWARGYADGFGEVLTTVREVAEKEPQFTLAQLVEELKAGVASLAPTDREPDGLRDEWDHGYADGFKAALGHVASARRRTGTVPGVLASLEQLWDALPVPEEQECGQSGGGS